MGRGLGASRSGKACRSGMRIALRPRGRGEAGILGQVVGEALRMPRWRVSVVAVSEVWSRVTVGDEQGSAGVCGVG